MSPAISLPGVKGTAILIWSLPATSNASTKFTPAEGTARMTWPARGRGSSTSSIARPAGGPISRQTTRRTSSAQMVQDRPLDLGLGLRVIDLGAVAIDDVERVDHLGTEGLHARRADVDVELGERVRDAVQHADAVPRLHIDHRGRIARIVVAPHRRRQRPPFPAPPSRLGAATLRATRQRRQ